ncbi:hypothetical protein [Geomicrobium sp. JCM 19055]|uniref:hypothetical protein n=1 Tax=Geomicrobium sp. JCM 19055 TaxID=1460649 RepID=UPI0005A6ECCF|nr:hypothetical protein [Geomicrobium sp. JCM 19055]
MKCAECEHWKRIDLNDGLCSRIHKRLYIELHTGWSGGVVESIETDEDFYCAEFSKKEAAGDE